MRGTAPAKGGLSDFENSSRLDLQIGGHPIRILRCDSDKVGQRTQMLMETISCLLDNIDARADSWEKRRHFLLAAIVFCSQTHDPPGTMRAADQDRPAGIPDTNVGSRIIFLIIDSDPGRWSLDLQSLAQTKKCFAPEREFLVNHYNPL
jgi:hypothetical protein